MLGSLFFNIMGKVLLQYLHYFLYYILKVIALFFYFHVIILATMYLSVKQIETVRLHYNIVL